MRKFLMLALFAAAIGAGTGCDGGGDGSGGKAGSGGSGGSGGGTTSSTTSSTTTTTSTGTGTTQNCDGLLPDPNDCGLCVQDQCCAELVACTDDAECNDCLTNPDADPNVCAANSHLTAINDCAAALCSDVCGGGGGAEPACDAPATPPSMGACVTIGTPAGNECNPITNEGCDGAAGAACDASQDGFTCYPDGNTQDLCMECGVSGSDYCKGGMTCVGKCARYCCDDADCGTGTCTKGGFADPNVGFCEAPAM
ncbi:MAG: hypothetical protein IPK82_26760 [Polyangiaceae bacterium]|nr:hypothetical protein [Polyangiaceae bacterium]